MADNHILPPITFCISNGLKPTVLQKYNLSSMFDFNFEMDKKNISLVWDAYVEGSYILNKLNPESILGIWKASVFGRGGGASSAKRHLLRSILLITDVGLQNVTNSKLLHVFGLWRLWR